MFNVFADVSTVKSASCGQTRVESIPTPGDCADGFFEAFWRRPEALLDPSVRASQSMWAVVGPAVERADYVLVRAGSTAGRLAATDKRLVRTLQRGGAVLYRVSRAPPSP